MPGPLRVGIVGAGAWAVGAHVPGFLGCDGVQVAAVCDTDPALAAAAAAAIAGAVPYGSVAAMLAADRLDVVSIATPTDSHAAIAGQCLGAGLHVLCEKPLGRTLEQAQAMADQAAATTAVTGMGFTMRYAPAVRFLKQLVEDGRLGQPTHVQMFLQNAQFLDPDKPLHWKMTRKHAGAGAVVEYGVHGIDLMRWMLGPVERVCATGRTFVPQRRSGAGLAAVDVEDSCSWIMDLACGASGVCHAGWTTIGRAPGLELRVFGTRAAARLVLSDDLPGSERLSLAEAASGTFAPVDVPAALATPLPVSETWRHRFQHALIANFVERVRGTGTPGPTFADGLLAQQVLDAVVRSMSEGRWVSL